MQVDDLRDKVPALKLSELLDRVLRKLEFARAPMDANDPALHVDTRPQRGGSGAYIDEEEPVNDGSSASTPAAAGETRSLSSVLLEEATQFASHWELEQREQLVMNTSSTNSLVPTTLASPPHKNHVRLRAFVDHIAASIEEHAAAPASVANIDAPTHSHSGGNDDGSSTVRQAVWLGTIHQAKGLQWPCVFVMRMNERVLPLVSIAEDIVTSASQATPKGQASAPVIATAALSVVSTATPAHATPASVLAAAAGLASQPVESSSLDGPDLDEERRVCYVAWSRAQDLLYLSYVNLDEEGAHMECSRFVRAVPSRHFDKWYLFAPRARPSQSHPSIAAAAATPSAPLLRGPASGDFVSAAAVVAAAGENERPLVSKSAPLNNFDVAKARLGPLASYLANPIV